MYEGSVERPIQVIEVLFGSYPGEVAAVAASREHADTPVKVAGHFIAAPSAHGTASAAEFEDRIGVVASLAAALDVEADANNTVVLVVEGAT
jgi:hypothetical protein